MQVGEVPQLEQSQHRGPSWERRGQKENRKREERGESDEKER